MLFLKDVSKFKFCFKGDVCKNSKPKFFVKEPTSSRVFAPGRRSGLDDNSVLQLRRLDTPILVPNLLLTHSVTSIPCRTLIPICWPVSEVPTVQLEQQNLLIKCL